MSGFNLWLMTTLVATICLILNHIGIGDRLNVSTAFALLSGQAVILFSGWLMRTYRLRIERKAEA